MADTTVTLDDLEHAIRLCRVRLYRQLEVCRQRPDRNSVPGAAREALLVMDAVERIAELELARRRVESRRRGAQLPL